MITLKSLYKDHDNLRRILFLLEKLLIEIYRGSSRDYSMLQRILVYIQEYPEHVHHPAEDAMFSVILSKGVSDRTFRKNIAKIMKDHSEIEGVTRTAIEAVDSMIINARPDITSAGEKLSTVISRQRLHLLFEEMNIYPHIEKYLDDGDWEKISALGADDSDPIFGDALETGYEHIFKAL